MPAALPGQADYSDYQDQGHRRQESSNSYANYTEDSDNRAYEAQGPYSPSASGILLPPTTYGHFSQSRSRAPSEANNLFRIDTSFKHDQSQSSRNGQAENSASANPDDFYRQYPAAHDQTSPAPATLHQDALRTLSLSNSRDQSGPQSRAGSNGSYSTNWSIDDSRDMALPPRVPGLKHRKSSVKNLVAQINASATTDAPPLPSQPASASYNAPSTSPFLSSAHVSQFGAVRKQTTPASSRRSTTTSSRSKSRDARTGRVSVQPASLLFGEVPGGEKSVGSAGYGIASPRRRAGSENSPMHSPNPMFPPEQRDSQFVLMPAVYNKTAQSTEHQRSRSEIVGGSSDPDGTTSTGSISRPPVTSRIPVSRRRMSAASDSGNSTPNSRAPSAIGRPRVSEDSRVQTQNDSSSNLSVANTSSLGKITSPGRRGKPATASSSSLPQGAKSPSLRAKIVAPPPRISPPLRSSRPRLPVSSASTASSRARMAEKFNAQQKLLNEKKTAQQRRAKPPELSDIDFNARRLRITQAITKSRESEELRARIQANKRIVSPARNSEARPDSSVLGLSSSGQRYTEQQTSEEPSPDRSGEDHVHATQNALEAMRGGRGLHANESEDSPTLGHAKQSFEKPDVHVQTDFLNVHNNDEPYSALTDMTAETDATHIDPEPQDQADGMSTTILSHVLQMRGGSPSGNFAYSPQSPAEDRDDRTDVESVNLVFRNTTYLDDEEAIRKGYRTNFAPAEPLPEEPEDMASIRDSWTSSIHEEPNQDDSYTHSDELEEQEQTVQYDQPTKDDYIFRTDDDSVRNTMASDAYTMINIVLQEHSSSGIVDQQFADDVYQKVLATCPEMEDEASYDSQRIEQLCLEEINRRDGVENSRTPQQDIQEEHDRSATPLPPPENSRALPQIHAEPTESPRSADLLTLPSTTFRHKHKSSLDSAEDFLTTSPSIGWINLSSDALTPPERPDVEMGQDQNQSSNEMQDQGESHKPYHSNTNYAEEDARHDSILHNEDAEPEEYGIAIIRPPTRSPPPPPKDYIPSIEQISRTPSAGTVDNDTRKPRVPFRVASLGQAQMVPRSSHSGSREPLNRLRSDITPWETQEQPQDMLSPEIRKLKQRKNVIRELVETENTYQKDMRVICDIYKQTAPAALSEDDIRVLFGNVEQVQRFARDFLTALKQTSRSLQSGDRKPDRNSSMDVAANTNSVLIDTDSPDAEKDRLTRIGDAFEGSLVDMEVVYAEYIRNRHGANQRLETLQKSPAAQEWLKECRDNSNDITNAWNLDALLVKPVQRLTKYPLLLKELIDATPEDHPDLGTLKRAMNSVTDINIRINDVKKHAEMLDQAINRKRGQSDVRTGISKAFGRKAEKLRQHVGITDMYEDSEYDKIRIAYDNNYVQLMVIANDCTVYEKGITQWVNKMVEVASAAEAWVDVGHSHHQQEESKLRHLAMIIRNVHNIALPDHVEHLHNKVIKPMTVTVDLLQRFKDDPKGLLQKRDKRLVDYAQMKNRKEKGEKIDKKTAERMDQWEALNTEAKDRMTKLLRATAHLVQSCQGHLVQLQMSWMAMIQQKFSSVMGINLNRLSVEEIERDWQEDFDYQEASALALGLCNGSLVLQAANMTSFLTPSTTLNGDDSPRQMSMSSMTNKRSISLHSESSFVPTLESSRPSGTYNQVLPESHFDRPYPYPDPNKRTRAASTTSGKSQKRPEMSSKTSNHTKHISAGPNLNQSRTNPSPVIQQDVFAPPRLSVETYSPLMNSFQQPLTTERPVSSNTFFSAAPGPSNTRYEHGRGNSGVFTSALPLSDSPEQERESSEGIFNEPQTLFTAASVYEFNIDRSRRDAGFPYLTYVAGEIFDVLGERGELWLARNQDDPQKQIGWIWNKHFAKLAE